MGTNKNKSANYLKVLQEMYMNAAKTTTVNITPKKLTTPDKK